MNKREGSTLKSGVYYLVKQKSKQDVHHTCIISYRKILYNVNHSFWANCMGSNTSHEPARTRQIEATSAEDTPRANNAADTVL